MRDDMRKSILLVMTCVGLLIGSVLTVTLSINQLNGMTTQSTESRYQSFLQTFSNQLDTQRLAGVQDLTDTHVFFWYNLPYHTRDGWNNVLQADRLEMSRFVLNAPFLTPAQDNPNCTSYQGSSIPVLNITFPGYSHVRYAVGGYGEFSYYVAGSGEPAITSHAVYAFGQAKKNASWLWIAVFVHSDC